MKTTRYRESTALWAAICLISGSMLPMSVQAQLLGPPKIKVQPSDMTVTNLGTATFSVTVDASLSLTTHYQWQFMPSGSSKWVTLNTRGSSGTKYLTLLDPSISYTQPGNTTTNRGAYSVILTSTLGASVTSSSAALNVVTAAVAFSAAGPTTNGFHVHVTGITGVNFVLYASPDLHNWAPIYTNTTLTGAADYTDPSAMNLNARYYKVLIQ